MIAKRGNRWRVVVQAATRSSASSSGGGIFMTGLDSTYSMATAYDMGRDPLTG